MDFPSFSTLFQTARNEVLLQNAQLTVESVDREGTDANVLIAAAAAASDEVVKQLISVVAGLYLDSANGTALDRLVLDRYGIARKQASGGTLSLLFTTTAPVAASFVIPAGTRVSTNTGIVYETILAETFFSGTTQIYVTARSTQAGLSQQVAIGTLNSIISSIANAPSDLGVTNPYASFGASDAETDSEYRARAQAFFTSSRRGTLSAIEQGALAVPGVVRAQAFEVLDTSGRPAAYVQLSIADAFTDTFAELGVNPPAYQTQSAALAQEVFNALQDYRPAGIFVQVTVAQTVLQPVQLALSFAAGVNVDAVALAARSSIVSYINNLSPGDDLVPADLVTVLTGIPGLINEGTAIYSPSGTVAATPLQVFRTNLSLVSATSLSPGTPIGSGVNPDQVGQ